MREIRIESLDSVVVVEKEISMENILMHNGLNLLELLKECGMENYATL
jgi:hypothetical protein